MYVDEKIRESFKEYSRILQEMYQIPENQITVDYDTGLVNIDGQTLTLEKLDKIIRVITGDEEKENQKNKTYDPMDSLKNQTYTIVDYRYYYIKTMVNKGFSIYDIAKYFQVSPKRIRETIKRIPEIDEGKINLSNTLKRELKIAIRNRDKYIAEEYRKYKDPIEAGQKLGFYKIPNQIPMLDIIMSELTQDKYKEILPEQIENMFNISFKEAIKKYGEESVFKLSSNTREWNKLKDIYFTVKEYPEIVELKIYKFKDTEIAEYLSIPIETVNKVSKILNIKYNNVSIAETLFHQKASSDISAIKIAARLLVNGEQIQDIKAISGLYRQHIADIREKLKQANFLKDDFSDAKKANNRKEQIIDLYINTCKSQDQIAKELGISRATVISDINSYLSENPDIKKLINQKKFIMSKSSRAENILLEILKPYGFIHAKSGTLKDEGLGRLELDMFHPALRIGIEYDGFVLQKNGRMYGHSIERDINKDKLCKENDINIIRIREPQLEEYENNDVKFFYTNCPSGDIYHENFVQCINNMIEYLNKEYFLQIESIDSILPYEEKINKRYLKAIKSYQEEAISKRDVDIFKVPIIPLPDINKSLQQKQEVSLIDQDNDRENEYLNYDYE